MFYYTSKIAWLLLQPSNLLLLLLAAGALALACGRLRLGRWLILPTTATLLVVGLLPIGELLLHPLEERFPRPELPARVDGVVVLSGVIDGRVAHDRGVVALSEAAERFTALLELGRHYPKARLVFTGGISGLLGVAYKEPDAMRLFCAAQGFDCGRIEYEEEARNTYENAVLTKALIDPQPGELWLLVTSASHIPRSVGIFRQLGWDVLPYPVDYRTGAEAGWLSTPNVAGRLRDLDMAVRAWIGLAAYRLTDRTDAWFPGPAERS
jgi:uncharacterized SAM-binding protein YcdF (DUF218 family)